MTDLLADFPAFSIWLLLPAGFIVVGVTVLVILMATAPMAWEDETGFHYGIPPPISFDRLDVYDDELR